MNRYRSPRFQPRHAATLVLCCVLAAGCGRQAPPDPMALAISQTGGKPGAKKAPGPSKKEAPEAEETALELNVLRVSDARLPDLDDEQFEFFLQTLNHWSTHLSRKRLDFAVRRTVPVDRYFGERAKILEGPVAGKGPGALHFDIQGRDAAARMRECLGEATPEMLRQYFANAPADLATPEAWAEYLVRDFRGKWESFRKAHPPHPALISPEHPEFSRPCLWRALADDQGERADLIVTNLFLAGAERRMDPDRIERGGLLVGFASQTRKKNASGLTMVVSVQPVLCRSPFVIDVEDRARPAVAAVCTWRLLHAAWNQEPPVVDPLGTAVRLFSEGQERR